MADIFISYAHATSEVAQRIAGALREQGYSVWLDDALPLHREFANVIEENVRAAKAVLVLWSAEARLSRWVPAEADLAFETGKLVQLSLDGAPPPFPFDREHCEIAVGWRGDLDHPAWRKLSRSIAALVTGRHREKASPAARASNPQAGSLEAERLLGVLAFDNLSGDAEMANFCDGVSEEIQQTVAQGSGLKVVARSSSFQFRGADKAVEKVTAVLGTTHLLDGSVRRSGSRVRITAQLVECEAGSTLWASRFDGDLSDVFALQDRIAAAVAEALEVTLSRAGPIQPLAPELYDLFLRARGMISEVSRTTGDAAPEATPLLEQVVEGAPEYAPGWEFLALSIALVIRSAPLKEEGVAEMRERALAAAGTALRLDAKRSGAYAAMALLEPWGGYAAREKLLQEALRAAPNDAGALTEMSGFYGSVGRFAEALTYAERAAEINPMMPAARLHAAGLRFYVGDYRRSIRMHQDLCRRFPENAVVLMALLNCTATGGFWQEFDEAVGRIGTFGGESARALSATRNFGEALRSPDAAFREKRLHNYTERFRLLGYLPLNLVESLAQLGFVDEAFEIASKSNYDVFNPLAPMPVGAYPGAIMTPWSPLNRSPRFVALSDKLGLNAYWLESDRWPDCIAWTPYDLRAEVRARSLAVAGSLP